MPLASFNRVALRLASVNNRRVGFSGLIESGGTETASVNNGGWVPLASLNQGTLRVRLSTMAGGCLWPRSIGWH